MRKSIFAFMAMVLVAFGLVAGPAPAKASVAASSAFSTLLGNTTIDSGGAIHSQARSIYSLGGGMSTFSGKRATFIAVDPPSFSAGCSGISWHFGGFSFISMDELRQLVEAISQASLGIAVDLAMQVLCPQCYAVMAKLRDIANQMRNAAADSCKTAKAMGKMVGNWLGVPDAKQTKCSESTSSSGESSSWIASAAGSLCRGLSGINAWLDTASDKVNRFLSGSLGSEEKTPDDELLSATFNVQYEVLTALGYKDGPMKDLLLNVMGMTIYPATQAKDCSGVFDGHSFWNDATPEEKKIYELKPGESASPTPVTAEANTHATQSKKTRLTCFAPPLMTGIQKLAMQLMCGYNPKNDMDLFASRMSGGPTPLSVEAIANSPIGQLCQVTKVAGGADTSINNVANLKLYTCQDSDTARCTRPKQTTYDQLVPSGGSSAYTGIAWMIADALFRGAANVATNTALEPETVALINGSGYPLYRLINLAAVYPGMANDVLMAYSATIALQYAVDTIDAVARPGAITAIETRNHPNNINNTQVNEIREMLTNMFSESQGYKSRSLAFLSEKRSLVQSILEINRALQAEVISQGLANNAGLALSLKKQLTPTTPSTP